MSFRVREANFETVFEPLLKAEERIPRATRQAWYDTGKYLTKKTSADIMRMKDGRVYYITRRKGGKPRRHVASRPFDTHANLKGNRGGLKGSLSWKVQSWDKMRFGYGVSTSKANKTPDYARAIEFGSHKPHIILPRPTIARNIANAGTKWAMYWEQRMDRQFK
jgi:hypothetical protein